MRSINLKRVRGISLVLALVMGIGMGQGRANGLYELSLEGKSYRFEDGAATDEASGYGGRIKGTRPVPLNGMVLILGGSASYTRMDWDTETLTGGGITYAPLPEDLYNVGVSAGLRIPLHGPWASMIRGAVSVASDMEDISGKDITGMVMAAFSWQGGEERMIMVGGGYIDSLNTEMVMPMVNVNWRFDSGWMFRFSAPQYISLGYPVSPGLELGGIAAFASDSYRLTEDAPFNHAVLTFKEVFAGIYGDWALGAKTSLRAQAGLLLEREIELTDADDDDITLADRDAENDLTFGIELRRSF